MVALPNRKGWEAVNKVCVVSDGNGWRAGGCNTWCHVAHTCTPLTISMALSMACLCIAFSLQEYNAKKVQQRKAFEAWLSAQPYDDEQ